LRILVGAILVGYGRDGFEEDEEVTEEGPGFDVLAIDRYALGVGQGAAAGDLPEAGESGLYAAVAGESIAVLFYFGGDDRAGAYKAHLAGENVPHLGELIEAVAAEEGADRGNTGVVAELVSLVPLGAGLGVALEVELKDFRGVVAHGSELPHGEELAVAADAAVRVKDWAGRTVHDNRADDEEQWKYHWHKEKHERYIYPTLENAIAEEAGGKMDGTVGAPGRGLCRPLGVGVSVVDSDRSGFGGLILSQNLVLCLCGTQLKAAGFN
jgi:hypothetical protein